MGSGQTFPMCFISMNASTWRNVLDFTDLGSSNNLDDIFKLFNEKLVNMDPKDKWDLDQVRLIYCLFNPRGGRGLKNPLV